MATGFKLSDGRDLSDIFTAGDAGITVGFQTSNGTDLGRQFMGGSTGVVTGFRDPSGIDLGSRFGSSPDGTTGWRKISGVPEILISVNNYVWYTFTDNSQGTSIVFYVYQSYGTYGVSVNASSSSPLTPKNASYIWFNGTKFAITKRSSDSGYDNVYAENQKVEAQAALNYAISACNSKTTVTAWYK